MTLSTMGLLTGAAFGCGLLLVIWRVLVIRRPKLALRVLPYVRDLPEVGRAAPTASASTPVSVVATVFGPTLKGLATGVERVLGGAGSVKRRLDRANLPMTVHEFRIEQVQWGILGFAAAAIVMMLRGFSSGVNPVLALIFCLLAFCVGVVVRDNRLSTQVKERERLMLLEFPVVAELLALSVAAGESPVSALERVVKRCGGEMSSELARVLAAVRTGSTVSGAFDDMSARTGIPLVARFAEGVAVSVERGTPLADVLHAQAADVREAGRRQLIETAARKEVGMMVPVVFFVLPVTILFALYPGFIGLQLTSP